MVKVRIEEIIIKHITEDNPDFSGLQQDYSDVKDKRERERYLRQDEERLEANKRGAWYYMGIIASARVSYPLIDAHPPGHRRLLTLDSGGIWGIESDAGKEYIEETEDDQLLDLKHLLQILHIDTSNFDDLSGQAEVIEIYEGQS